MKLWSIHYSPWSLRAKWSLRHHGLEYESAEYLSMVSTPRVRWEISDWTGVITVPILVDGAHVLRDSFDIARYADSIGSGPPLMNREESALRHWTDIAEEIADAGRVLTTAQVVSDPQARIENIPGFVPRRVRRFVTPVVDAASLYLARKYRFDDRTPEEHLARIERALEQVADALATSEYLGSDEFGWPDIAVVTALQFVRPKEGWIRLGRASSAAWTRAELVDRFSHVLEWRDRVHEGHFPAR